MRRVQSEIGGMLCRDSECAAGRALQCEIQRRTEIIPQSAACRALRKKRSADSPEGDSTSSFFGASTAIRTRGLSLRRRKKCSPSLPANVPQALDITGFLTISRRSHFLQKPLFYPSAISRKLAELILAVGHFPGSFAKISKLTEITFVKNHQISEKSSVLLNLVRC